MAPVGIAIHSQGIVEYVNPYGRKILEVERSEDLIGSSVQSFVRSDFMEIAKERVRKLYDKEVNYLDSNEEVFVTLKGNEKTVLISGAAIDHNGKPAICNIFTDITTLKEVQNELVQSNNELDNFVYRVSHDLRAPIASSSGLARMITHSNSLDEIHMYSDLLEKSLGKLDQFIKDILDYSRNKRIETKIEEIQIEKIIDDIVLDNQYSISEANIEVSLQYNMNAPLFSDRMRVKVILQNLISNAIKYQNPYIISIYFELSWLNHNSYLG